MKEFIKKYIPYIIIVVIGLLLIKKREYGIGLAVGIGGCFGYYHGIDKHILKH